MTKKKNIFQPGDCVWAPASDRREIKVPCPVCAGKKEVTLILGTGERCILPCNYCGKCFCEPTGYITECTSEPQAELVVISQVRIEKTTEGEEIEYVGNHYVYREVYGDKDSALERSRILCKERDKEERRRQNYTKHDKMKSYSWNAGYHLREARREERSAENHRKKARLCKEKAKREVEES